MSFYPLFSDIFMITLSSSLENLLFNTYQNWELCMCLLFILVVFLYWNTRVVPHFHHHNFIEIIFFNFRTLNGASQLTEFPDLTGTTSLESL